METESHTVLINVASLCCLLMLVSVVRHYSKNSLMPAEGWVLLAGIFYGIGVKQSNIEWLPLFELSPDLVIVVFLPLLIFASGRLVDLKALKLEALPIGFFAIFGVIATSFMIGAPIAWILGVPLLHGLLIGAAAGATDPAAVAAIFHSFKIPERLGLIVEGESLFNDGTTVVLFALISGLILTDKRFDFAQSTILFVWAVSAAIPLGALIGWAGARLLHRWKESNVFYEVSLTFIVSYTAYLLAEELLHVSGVIAVLLAAIIFFKTRTKDSQRSSNRKSHQKNYQAHYAEHQKILGEFWDYLSIVVNGLLFFSLGAATGLHDFQEVPTEAVIVAVMSMIIARGILVYGGSGLLRLVNTRLPLAWQHILYLGGLRGAVSAALILIIPHDYPHRGSFLCMAFAMIAFSLIVQPTLMKLYLRRAVL